MNVFAVKNRTVSFIMDFGLQFLKLFFPLWRCVSQCIYINMIKYLMYHRNKVVRDAFFVENRDNGIDKSKNKKCAANIRTQKCMCTTVKNNLLLPVVKYFGLVLGLLGCFFCFCRVFFLH